MALRINLYHEIQRQEVQRRRDPLRLGMYAMGAIALGFVLFYFYRLNSAREVNNRLGALRLEWAKLEPRAKLAKTHEDEITAQIKTRDALLARIENRIHWAPVIEDLVRTVPREVQVLRLGGELAVEPGKTDAISLTGLSGSAEPRKVAEELRKALEARLAGKFKNVSSSFKTLEDSEEAVMVGGRRMPVANFTLDFQLNPAAPAAPEPAAAPARKPKS